TVEAEPSARPEPGPRPGGNEEKGVPMKVIDQFRRITRRCRAGAGARWQRLRTLPQAGMATAEYAIATLAAAGFAGLLLVILRSDQVRGFLVGIIQQALSIGG